MRFLDKHDEEPQCPAFRNIVMPVARLVNFLDKHHEEPQYAGYHNITNEIYLGEVDESPPVYELRGNSVPQCRVPS